MTTWENIDKPVLEFLADLPSSMPPGMEWKLELRPTIASVDVPHLSEREIDQSLLRLRSAALVDAQGRTETASGSYWVRPRVTASGAMVLGRWPNVGSEDLVGVVSACLVALSDIQPTPEDADNLKRAVGLLTSLGGGVALKVVAGAAASAAGEVGQW